MLTLSLGFHVIFMTLYDSPFSQKPFFHSNNTDTLVDLKHSESVASSLALEVVASMQWETNVCWYLSLSVCTTVGRYGWYLSSQQLKLDSTDHNNSPAGFPSCAFSLALQPNTCITPGAFLILLHLFFPSNNTFLSSFTLFSHINRATTVDVVYYIHYMRWEIVLAISLRLFLYDIPVSVYWCASLYG